MDFESAIEWLEVEAKRIIREARREMNDGVAAFPPQVGIGYDAFWLRDYQYTLEGAVDAYSNKELIEACRVFVENIRDDGAGLDCIRYDGTPIYKPGYGTMGDNPVADGSQFTVGVAWHTYRQTKDAAFIRTILDSLDKTLRATPRDPDNGLVHISPESEWDRCAYGFTDTVRKAGNVLFCSILYIQACRQLSSLFATAERDSESAEWRNEGLRVEESVRRIFWDEEFGLFRAATIRCREHDVWGSAFAAYLGVADEHQSEKIGSYFRDHYDEIVYHGQIRHNPAGEYWEVARERDTYQNGAYWATPTGWFVYALDPIDSLLAERTILDMVEHFKTHGACEWIIGEVCRLPNYLASAALPLAGIRQMIKRRAV